MAIDFDQIEKDALAALAAATDSAALEKWRVACLGRSAPVMTALGTLGTLPREERKAFGQRGNQAKQVLERAFEEASERISRAELASALEEGAIDVTLPGRRRGRGGLHPATQTLREIYAIWAEMGFQVYRSRDVEDDEINFSFLNIPPHHPARDMWDTFHTTTPGVILRTHTSPGQIRAMREYGATGTQPIRVILPGMCYRYEQISARSEIQFNQVEGLAVGRNIRMTDLKGTIAEFARRMFGPQVRVRFRRHHFPFTEPSRSRCRVYRVRRPGLPGVQADGLAGDRGCGMVHPVVLQNGGYDPRECSGLRLRHGAGAHHHAQARHPGHPLLLANDLRFLEQF